MKIPFKVRNLPHRLRGLGQELLALADVAPHAELRMQVHRLDGTTEDLGVVSRRVVTNAGVAFLVDAFQNLAELENMNWHAAGTGSTAEAVGDTALVAEVGSRVSGTQSEPASNQYRSVATITFGSTLTIQEHGLFSANSAGTLWDRSVHASVGVSSGESITYTYTVTFPSGG